MSSQTFPQGRRAASYLQMRMPARLLIPLVLLAAAGAGTVLAQQPAPLGPGDTVRTKPEVTVDSASPRTAVTGFIESARAGDFDAAASWLDLSRPDARGRGPLLAQRLYAVLDARLDLDVDQLSPLASGDTTDGLPRDREQIGEIPSPDGSAPGPVRLSLQSDGDRRRWRFSPLTVSRIEGWYDELPDRWIRERLPIPLLRAGPFEVLWWQWIALFAMVPLAVVIGWFMSRPTRSLFRRLVARTKTELDDALVASSRGPLILLWGIAASRILLDWIALASKAQKFVVDLQSALVVVAIFWIALRVVGVLQTSLPGTPWASSHPAFRSLIPLGARVGRVVIFLLGLLTVISQFGYPIATILTGLGIGGIAIALGAQKTLENFFGSVSIGIDQPFRVGDWVSIDGMEGEVEAIGLRSTRIRSIQRTVISIPNGRLADMRTENFGERERIQFRFEIGLLYSTPVETLRKVRGRIEAMLRAHPSLWSERLVVRLQKFSSSSIDMEIFGWVTTTVVDEFRAVREELMFGIITIIEEEGAEFAFPTQTIHLKREGSAPTGSALEE